MKRLFLILVIIISAYTLKAQEVTLDHNKTPLDQVILDLRDRYHLQFSFSNSQLSKFSISVNKSFSNVDTALDFLFSNNHYRMKKLAKPILSFPKK